MFPWDPKMDIVKFMREKWKKLEKAVYFFKKESTTKVLGEESNLFLSIL